MPVTNWMCLKCGVTNPKTFFKCQTRKPIFWECTSCKTKNPTASLKCGNCKRKRPAMFANAVNIKSAIFNCEASRSVGDMKNNNNNNNNNNNMIMTTGSVASSIGQQLPPPSPLIMASALPTPTLMSQVLANSTASTMSNVQMSSISQATKSTMSTISQSVSSYDIFLKISKPSRTVKQINYVDSEERYEAAVQNCARTGKPFSDTSFPTTNRSLYFVPQQNNPSKTNKIYWLRPKDMRPPESVDPKSPILKLPWCVANQPIAGDIVQGILGNCWLLSALAVLVEKPALLDKLLATKELSDKGIYRLRLYRDGKLTSVIVDEQFPCTSRRQLIYSSAKRKQLFVPLIEKAMAKMYGCYESLVSGQTTEGLSAFTGFPCRSIRTQVVSNNNNVAPNSTSNNEVETMLDSDMIWTLLLSYQTAGFPMGAGCGCDRESTITAEEYQSKGLMMQHAYSILSVMTVDSLRMVQLRNPWGRQVWNGDWSDESPLWTDELREQLEPNKASQGIFWMTFLDFQRYFEKVDVCKLRDNWQELRFEGYFPSSCTDFRFMSVFEVHVEEMTTELEFTLHQESRRAVNLRRAPLLPISTAIFQLKDVQRNIAGDFIDYSGYKIREFVGCDVMVDKGVYLVAIFAFNHWSQSSETTKTGRNLRPRFVLSLHSSRFVTVNCYCPSPSMIGDTLIEMTITKGKQKKHSDFVVSYYMSEDWSGLLIVIENRSPNGYMDVIFDAAESTNLYATRGSLMTQDTLPPMSRQLVNVLSHLDPSTPYYLSYQMSYRSSNDSTSNHMP
ncbi:Calpain-15 [Blomia tropicalis]|nr:Calpain-15 [Blomia tropicalis]